MMKVGQRTREDLVSLNIHVGLAVAAFERYDPATWRDGGEVFERSESRVYGLCEALVDHMAEMRTELKRRAEAAEVADEQAGR